MESDIPASVAPLGQADFTALVEAVKTVVTDLLDRPEPQTFDQVGARAYLGISRTVWFRAKAKGDIPDPVLVGGTPRWRRLDLQKYLERLRPFRKRRNRKPPENQA